MIYHETNIRTMVSQLNIFECEIDTQLPTYNTYCAYHQTFLHQNDEQSQVAVERGQVELGKRQVVVREIHLLDVGHGVEGVRVDRRQLVLAQVELTD